MTETRRLLAIVCIAVIVFAVMTPAVSHLVYGVLVPIGPLFGTVISISVPLTDDVDLGTAPVLSVLTSRAPPTA